MATTTAGRTARFSFLFDRQLNSYPKTPARMTYLVITVLATIMLYYELYVGGSVSTLILEDLHIGFTFYLVVIALGNLVGAVSSLAAGITDRFGRANLVVFGLLFSAIFVEFALPAATDKWTFMTESFVVGLIEGMCLVATPALIRDFSPQVGRATAMGFWTAGPVLGTLTATVVGTLTIPEVVHDPHFWTHEYRICGAAGFVVFLIALFGLRELSPQLRDQVMVDLEDRALIEARAQDLDIEAATRNPFRQLMKKDIVLSALAVSVMLLISYTGFSLLVIYVTTVFGFSLKQANAIGNWQAAANLVAVIAVGVLSDRLRVRKPFMLLGGGAAAVMAIVFLAQAGQHPSYYSLAIITAGLSFFLGAAYTPWMAGFTETVEAHNPALVATGLAIWGGILRVVISTALLLVPVVVSSASPLVDYGPTVAGYATQYRSELEFLQAHPDVVAASTRYRTELADAQKFAPEIAVIEQHGEVFTQLAAYPNPAAIPPPLLSEAVAAAGGGAKGVAVLQSIAANFDAIEHVIAAAPQLHEIATYQPQLTAVAQVPPQALSYLQAHAGEVTQAQAETPGQWRSWFWVCVAGILFYVLCIPLQRGRWLPSRARQDALDHRARTRSELGVLEDEQA